MEPTVSSDHEEIVRLLRENQSLLQQNNELLHKQEQRERRRLIFKVIWYTILLGIPLIAYYYLYSMFTGFLGGGPTTSVQPVMTPAVLEQLLELYTTQ